MEGKGFRLLTDLGGLKHSDDHHHGHATRGKETQKNGKFSGVRGSHEGVETLWKESASHRQTPTSWRPKMSPGSARDGPITESLCHLG